MKKYPQQEYNREWIEKNREHKNYLSSRSAARSFVRNRALEKDLVELEELIEERRKTLKTID